MALRKRGYQGEAGWKRRQAPESVTTSTYRDLQVQQGEIPLRGSRPYREATYAWAGPSGEHRLRWRRGGSVASQELLPLSGYVVEARRRSAKARGLRQLGAPNR